MKAARSMLLDKVTGHIEIDGVPFPFYVSEDLDVDFGEPGSPITTVWLGVMVDGVVTLKAGRGPQFIIPGEGEVGEYARRLVREGLLERLPWLRGVEA